MEALMPAAGIIAAGVIGAGASIISANKSTKAANKATQAQVDANNQSLALQRDIYDQNKGILSPYVQQGYAANNALAGLLGLDTGGGVTTAGGGAAPSGYQSAFDNYRNSTGYNFRMNEGMDALNSKFAARGVLNSGAAAKSALSFAQGLASDEYGRYVGALSGQQQIGYGAGGALAGVGTNFANTSSNINANTADAIGNGALAKANISNNLTNSIAGIAGNVIGGLSSYGGGGLFGNGGSTSAFYGISGNRGIY
jgi:hypothetical protein